MFNLPKNKKDPTISSEVEEYQLIQLQKQVDSMTIHNYKILQKIQQLDPNYQYELYEIKTNSLKQSAFKKQLLIKQKEKLLQEKKQLERDLQMISIQKSPGGLEQYNQVNQYAFLRSTWSRFKGLKLEDCADRVEHLNKTICVLKNNIVKMTHCQRNYALMPDISHHNSNAYQKLKNSYEQICMIHEDQNMVLMKKIEQIQKQKQINQCLKSQIFELKTQIKKTQTSALNQKLKAARLQEKIQVLKDKLHENQKKLKKIDIQQNIKDEPFDGLKNNNELVYVNEKQKMVIKILCSEIQEKLSYEEKTTQASLKQLLSILASATNCQQTSFESKIPKLAIINKSLSSHEVLPDRFITNERLEKTYNEKYNSRTYKKALILDKTDNLATKNKKFSRTGYNQSFESTQDADKKPLLQNRLKKSTSYFPNEKFAQLTQQLDKLNEINPEIKI